MFLDFDVWRCPNKHCRYILTDTEMQLVRYDYGCPKCRTPFKKFVPEPAESPNKPLHPDAENRCKLHHCTLTCPACELEKSIHD